MNPQLENTLEEAVAAMGCEWVGCEWTNANGQGVLRVYVDMPGGISLDQVAKVSRELGAILDVEDFAPNAYRLEVSSPGIERPLFRLGHYESRIGERVSLKLRMPDAKGRRRFKGVIESVVDPIIRIAIDDGDECLEVTCAQIEKGKLVVEI
jgi:ribosome maturation factor RimP